MRGRGRGQVKFCFLANGPNNNGKGDTKGHNQPAELLGRKLPGMPSAAR